MKRIITTLFLFLFAITAHAALTPAQRATLAAAIAADGTLSILPPGNSSSVTIANAFNAVSSPDYIVWKTSVDPNEIMRNGLDWTRVDNLTVGKARIWDWLTKLGNFDCSRENIRAGIDASWVGTAQDLAVRATVYTHCKRSATRLEKLFAAGTGTTASPATMVVEGTTNPDEIQLVLGW